MKNVIVLAVLLMLTAQLNFAQKNNNSIPLIGETVPSFKAQSTNGEINFPEDFGKSWKILFSHPKDYTPVCSSELLDLAYRQDEFKKLNTQLIVISTDILSQHQSWKKDLEKLTAKYNKPASIDFPLIDDHKMTISRKYGMLHEAANPETDIRGVFIIDPNNVVRSIQFYPHEVGRNIDEILRSVAALQTTSKNDRLLTPANWKPGDDFLVSYLTKEEEALLEKNEGDLRQETWFMTYRKNSSVPPNQ